YQVVHLHAELLSTPANRFITPMRSCDRRQAAYARSSSTYLSVPGRVGVNGAMSSTRPRPVAATRSPAPTNSSHESSESPSVNHRIVSRVSTPSTSFTYGCL